MKIGKLKIGKSDRHLLMGGTGSSSEFAIHGGKAGAWFDHMTYRPFEGAHRGYVYRIPIIGKRIADRDIKKTDIKQAALNNKRNES